MKGILSLHTLMLVYAVPTQRALVIELNVKFPYHVNYQCADMVNCVDTCVDHLLIL